MIIKPQDGYQHDYIMSPADIVIGGGAAGAGKTFSLLMDALKWTMTGKDFGAVIFRRTYPEIMQIGGLWEESKKIFPYRGGTANESKVTWVFDNGSRIGFSHLQHEKDLNKFQGAQIPYIGFDEVTHFSKQMFFYLLTRNRGTTQMRPRIRATCNPDPDSWVAEFIQWWIDEETGFPIPERAGVVRYFVMDDSTYIWGGTKKEVYDKAHHLFKGEGMEQVNPNDLIKSATFIPGSIYENRKLLAGNPQYLANLMSQDEETRARLLKGNWKIRADQANLFDIFKIKDMFRGDGSEVSRAGLKKYITIDHARFGKDLCIIMSWEGFRVERIDIMKKSDTNDILRVIKHIRKEMRGISVSNIMIDQDGIGVKDALGCRIFQPGGVPYEVKREKPFVNNKRTQCYVEMSERVNNNEASINMENIYLHEDGRMTRVKTVTIRGETHTVEKMILDDLRTVKREMFELDKPVKITAKETQKAILKRSPDFGDTFAMRGAFEFLREPKGMGRP